MYTCKKATTLSTAWRAIKLDLPRRCVMLLLKQYLLLLLLLASTIFTSISITTQLRFTFQFTLMDSLITNSQFMHFKIPTFGVLIRVFLSLCVVSLPSASLVKSSKDFTSSMGDQWQPSPFLTWNITGTYGGSWGLLVSKNSNSRSPKVRKSSGDSVLELISKPTKIWGLHYVQGKIIFHDVFDNEHEVGGAQINIEGVYIWPLRHLRVEAYRGKAGDFRHEDDYILSYPYHLAFKQLGVFSSQVFQESPWVKIWKKKYSPVNDMEKHCNITIAAQISRVLPMQSNGYHDCYHIKGSMLSFAVDDNGDCLQPMLLHATSVNTETYYNKAVGYTLMVTFISILEVFLLIRQRVHSNTPYGLAKVSILVIGQQAIMDVYLCLSHLTAGVIVATTCAESLLFAFSIAAIFKFAVVIFEMKYFLAIWKSSRHIYIRESSEATRRARSVLYNRFYGILLGGILGVVLIIYEFPKFLPFIILIVHSFWIPQIVTNIVHDPIEPLHPCYIIGMSVTRLTIPLYIFGCPHNFMRTKSDRMIWCIGLVGFVGLQTLVLLLQHNFGSGCFILQKIFLIKYSYHRRSDQDINRATDCAICMTVVDFSKPLNVCMVTPCNHFFHSECLQKWMDVKMVCPICRRRLPPV